LGAQIASTPAVAVLPGDGDQVRDVLAACAAAGVPFVPRGACSGLSDGALPDRRRCADRAVAAHPGTRGHKRHLQAARMRSQEQEPTLCDVMDDNDAAIGQGLEYPRRYRHDVDQWTVGQLRHALQGLPDDLTLRVEVAHGPSSLTQDPWGNDQFVVTGAVVDDDGDFSTGDVVVRVDYSSDWYMDSDSI
jgi:hypothetical protein